MVIPATLMAQLPGSTALPSVPKNMWVVHGSWKQVKGAWVYDGGGWRPLLKSTITLSASNSSVVEGAVSVLTPVPTVPGLLARLHWEYKKPGAATFVRETFSEWTNDWRAHTPGVWQWRVVGEYLAGGETAYSNVVSVTVTYARTTVSATASSGTPIEGAVVAFTATPSVPTSVASYEWHYKQPGAAAFTKWSPSSATMTWASNSPGAWQWKAIAVQKDGVRVESNVIDMTVYSARSTVTITGPTRALSTQSGAGGPMRKIVDPTFTITLSNPTAVAKVELSLHAASTGWQAPRQTWAYPSTTSLTHTVPFSTNVDWLVRAVITHKDGAVVGSNHHSIQVRIKTLSVTNSGGSTPTAGSTVTFYPACGSDCPSWQNGASMYYTTNGSPWTAHPMTWPNVQGNEHWWSYREDFPDGSYISSPYVSVTPKTAPVDAPESPANTGETITSSERYSFSNTTNATTQYCPIYLGVRGHGVVEWLEAPPGQAWRAMTRRSRPSTSPDAGYGGYAKTCVFPDIAGTWQFRARWTDAGGARRITPIHQVSIAAAGASFGTKMRACLSVINAGPALYSREIGYVNRAASDGDTFRFQNTESNYTTNKALGFTLTTDGGAVRSASDTSWVACRFLGAQAPEFAEDGTKGWGWGKSAWRRVNELMPVNTRITMQSRNSSGRGFDSSTGSYHRICRSVWVNDLSLNVSDLLLDEGLAKEYTQNNSVEETRANANMARTERASLAGIGLYRNTTAHKNQWQVTFDGSNVYLKNLSAGTTDVGTWHVADAATVSSHFQIKDKISAAKQNVARGATLTIPYSEIDNSGVESIHIYENSGGEPGDVICWAARGGTSSAMRSIPMAISRSS